MVSNNTSGFYGLAYSPIEDLIDGDIALRGAHNPPPCELGKPSHSEDAPDAIRDIGSKVADHRLQRLQVLQS